MRNNRIVALCYRCAAFIACLIGVLDTVGVFKGHFNGEMLLFYTTETNVFVVLMFGLLLIRTARGLRDNGPTGPSSYHERLSAVVALSISMTLLVFWVLLAPTITDLAFLLSYSNLQIHLIAPLLMLFDFFFFATPGKLKRQDPWFFALIPLAYFAQSTILGFSGFVYEVLARGGGAPRHFPYFFIDFDQLHGQVFIYVFALVIFFIGFAYLFLWIDHMRARRARRTASPSQDAVS
jgi:hypothetical protein